MFRKKLVLTATTCEVLEKVRLAIEVLKGARVRFKHVQLKRGVSGEGAVYYHDGEEKCEQVSFYFFRKGGALTFKLEGEWFCARFDSDGQTVNVIEDHTPNKETGWRIGTSFCERRVGPPL